MDKGIKDWILVKRADCEDSIIKSSHSDDSDDGSISIINLTDSPSEEEDLAPHQIELQDMESISTETYHQQENWGTNAPPTENPLAKSISCEYSTIDEEPDKHEETILRPYKVVISSAAKAEDLIENYLLTSVEVASLVKLHSADHVLEQSVPHMKGRSNFQSSAIYSDQNGACEENLMQRELLAQEGRRSEDQSQIKLNQHIDSSQVSLAVDENLDGNPLNITTAILQDPAYLLDGSGIDMRTGMYYLAVHPEPTTAQIGSKPEEIVDSFGETPLGLQTVKSSAASEESILDRELLEHSIVDLFSPTIKERLITDKKTIPAKRLFFGYSKRCKTTATRKCFITDKISSKEHKKTTRRNISKRLTNAKHLKRNRSDFETNIFANVLPCIIGLTFGLFIIEIILLDAAKVSEDQLKQAEKDFESSRATHMKELDKMDRPVPNDWELHYANYLKARNKLPGRLRTFN